MSIGDRGVASGESHCNYDGDPNAPRVRDTDGNLHRDAFSDPHSHRDPDLHPDTNAHEYGDAHPHSHA
ncbi:MAG: hypothetical protein ACLFTI_01630 [Anaerolineales bacterium]